MFDEQFLQIYDQKSRRSHQSYMKHRFEISDCYSINFFLHWNNQLKTVYSAK